MGFAKGEQFKGFFKNIFNQWMLGYRFDTMRRPILHG